MTFEPTPDQQAFIHQAIASGRYRNAEDAIREAMARWQEDERLRFELLAALDDAEADLLAGQYADYSDKTLRRLAEELKREARALRDTERRS